MTDPGPQGSMPPAGETSPAEKRARSATMAVVGFVLALMGPALFWIWLTFGSEEGDQAHFVGTYGLLAALLVGLAGAAVCFVVYRKAKRQHESKGLALAGMIIGVTPTVVVVGGFLLFFIVTLIFGA